MKRTVVFLGPPASGKGSQAVRFSRTHGFLHFDMGGALREEVETCSPLADKIRAYTDAGQLVPLELVSELVNRTLNRNSERDVLLDGFPRSMEQAEMLEGVLERLGRQLTMVVLIDVPEPVVVERTVNRRVCPTCGRIYNLLTFPPRNDQVCDDDAAELSHRRDDTEELIRARLKVYRQQTQPIIAHYESAGVLARVDGCGDMDAVGKQIESIVLGE
ncbi:MAG: hypothetical protein A2Y63_04395 [Candidatus Riflebacteria bacterium RBG_13_59_9]|nr:MAG: hypothetical protein A2Y63_04395 [Candidatus Riflebacteria bacterium RBG_13_59_9]